MEPDPVASVAVLGTDGLHPHALVDEEGAGALQLAEEVAEAVALVPGGVGKLVVAIPFEVGGEVALDLDAVEAGQVLAEAGAKLEVAGSQSGRRQQVRA